MFLKCKWKGRLRKNVRGKVKWRRWGDRGSRGQMGGCGPGWEAARAKAGERAGRAEPEKVAETTLGRIKRKAGWVRIGKGRGEQGTAKLCSIKRKRHRWMKLLLFSIRPLR